jgi:hypothetical protein
MTSPYRLPVTDDLDCQHRYVRLYPVGRSGDSRHCCLDCHIWLTVTPWQPTP